MNQNTIVTLTVNIDVWVGINEDVDIEKEVTDTMDRLNNHDLEEYGGCHLLDFSITDVPDEDNHNYINHYDLIDRANGRGRHDS